MSVRRACACCLAAIVTSTLAGPAIGAAQGSGNFKSGPGFHATVPSGYNIVQLKPSGKTVELFGLVECPEIEGMQQLSEGVNARIIDPQGVVVAHFPHHFSFRVTVTLRKPIPEPPEQFVNTEQDPQEFLLSLGFRLKIYDGLYMSQIAPESVAIIGVPADIAYDERVFRVRFSVTKLPVTTRVVLEALSPKGEPISHFVFAML